MPVVALADKGGRSTSQVAVLCMCPAASYFGRALCPPFGLLDGILYWTDSTKKTKNKTCAGAEALRSGLPPCVFPCVPDGQIILHHVECVGTIRHEILKTPLLDTLEKN